MPTLLKAKFRSTFKTKEKAHYLPLTMASFDGKARQAFPAEVYMISGSHDAQTSADVSNVNTFQLPDPAGRAGGACTSALLQVLYADHKASTEQLSWVAALRKMRTVLRGMGYDQIPQLTSSCLVDVQKPMYIVPPNSTGTKRAVLIGINYTGQQGQLSGCHNDVKNIKEYLEKVHGFRDQDIIVLMDDGKHHEPTYKNIINAFKRIAEYSKAGDVVFLHYSGHGGSLPDDNGDEDDGYDETLIPVDFREKGQIRDDFIFEILVHPLKAGVHMTCLMDCCHSGTVLDLPYRFTADGDATMRCTADGDATMRCTADGDARRRNVQVDFGRISMTEIVELANCLLSCFSYFVVWNQQRQA